LVTMVVVEDRILTLDALRTEIKWQKNGIKPLGFFPSCEQAWSTIVEKNPDVVVTDIIMPIKNGLDFCEQIHTLGKDIKVILISAHNKFEYAKKAIKLNVFDYLEKPLDYSVLVQSVLQAGDARRQERKLQEHIEKNREFFVERFFVKLLSGRFASDSINIRNELDFLRIDLNAPRHVCVILQPSDIDEFDSGHREMVLYWMFSQTVEQFGKQSVYGPFYLQDYSLTLILSDNASSPLSKTRIHEFFNNLIGETCEKYKFGASVGVGGWAQDIGRIGESYRLSFEALEYKFLFGPGKIYDSEDITVHKKNNWIPYIELEESLLNRVGMGDDTQVREIIARMREFALATYLEMSAAKSLILATLCKLDIIGIEDKTEKESDAFSGWISKLESMHQCFDYLEEVCLNYSFATKKRFLNYHDRLTTEIKQYIENNFSDWEFNLVKIAKHVNMSANYVSTIYKKQTGSGISEYLTKVRIDAAKKLLHDTTMQVNDVSASVGYSSPYYFSQSFKKITGVSPARYREQNNTERD